MNTKINQSIQLEQILTDAYNTYKDDLNRHAFYKLNNGATSEDLVQDTFIKTWNYLIKGGKIHLIRSFLYHVLNNLIIDQYRKHKTTSLDTLLEKGFEPCIDNSVNLSDIADGKATLKLVEKLPKAYRQIIDMRYIQDLSLNEISAITGQCKNTIAVQVHRGISKLKLLYV
jgi:RNA polymerase sigma-70 factor (ECF subfamily)